MHSLISLITDNHIYNNIKDILLYTYIGLTTKQSTP